MGILLVVTPAPCHSALSETVRQRIPRERSPCPGAALLGRGKPQRCSERQVTGGGEESQSHETALEEADVRFRSGSVEWKSQRCIFMVNHS